MAKRVLDNYSGLLLFSAELCKICRQPNIHQVCSDSRCVSEDCKHNTLHLSGCCCSHQNISHIDCYVLFRKVNFNYYQCLEKR